MLEHQVNERHTTSDDHGQNRQSREPGAPRDDSGCCGPRPSSFSQRTSNAPAHLRRASVSHDSTPHPRPADRCSGLFGGSATLGAIGIDVSCQLKPEAGQKAGNKSTVIRTRNDAQVLKGAVHTHRYDEAGCHDVMAPGHGKANPA